jgi:Ca-activated chloride channel family protein
VTLQGAPSMAGTPFIPHATGVAGGVARGRAAANAGVPRRADPTAGNREGYDRIVDNPFLDVRANPQSTFAADVDRASYGNVRRFLDGGTLPPKDAVRIEELVNYFPYALPSPRADEPFSVTTEVAPAPWSPTHRLVRIGLQTARIEARSLPPSNLVFLIDVSGSMQPADKLPLLKRAFAMLVDQLREQDRVAIVVYAGSAGLVLESTRGSDKPRILEAIERLEAGGSTAGGEGLRLAYDVARRHHVRGGVNRVILATDGDFNVGESSDAAIERLVEEKRQQGTFLTVLGFGTGNYQDAKMEKLADRGNGNYAYVDNVMEARKALVHEMGATLHTVAKDVKLQVEFNPARVAAYRLIGYENRLLRAEDFADDTKDAGEMGAGHAVTALYEIVPVGARTSAVIRGVDSLRYQRPTERTGTASGPELAFVKLRYKAPDGDRSRLMEHAILDRGAAPSPDLTFAASVAAFGMVLRESEHRGTATLDDVIAMATRTRGEDANGYRAEFIELARKARAIKAGSVVER